MKYHRLYIQAIAGVVALGFVIVIWASGLKADWKWLFRGYSLAVLLAVLLWAAWDRWIWRTSLVQRMQFIPPDVAGTWKGMLRSHWTAPDTETTIPEKDAYLVVRQTFSGVSTMLFTDESQSGSYSLLAKVTRANGLSYLYLNEPEMKANEGSQMHRGAAMFRLSGSPVDTMRGRYWTDRDTKGELVFKERRSECADDYRMAARLFDAHPRESPNTDRG